MTPLTVRHAACTLTVSMPETNGGRSVIHLDLAGSGHSQDIARCLEQVRATGLLQGASCFIVDNQDFASTISVPGQAAQAQALLSAGVCSVWLCLVNRDENADLILHLLRDVYRAHGVEVTTARRPTTAAALAWMDRFQT